VHRGGNKFSGGLGEAVGCLLSVDLQSPSSSFLLSLLACLQDLLILTGMLPLERDTLNSFVIPRRVVVVDEGLINSSS